jgi:hypothetical protein
MLVGLSRSSLKYAQLSLMMLMGVALTMILATFFESGYNSESAVI